MQRDGREGDGVWEGEGVAATAGEDEGVGREGGGECVGYWGEGVGRGGGCVGFSRLRRY